MLIALKIEDQRILVVLYSHARLEYYAIKLILLIQLFFSLFKKNF
jgi:hypothetical protein